MEDIETIIDNISSQLERFRDALRRVCITGIARCIEDSQTEMDGCANSYRR